MNNDLNNNTPSYDPLLNGGTTVAPDEPTRNEEFVKEYEDTKEAQEKVEKDFSLPTSLEDYLMLSKNFYAGFWTRFVAYVIDMIVIYAVSSLLNTFSFGLLNKVFDFPILGEESLS